MSLDCGREPGVQTWENLHTQRPWSDSNPRPCCEAKVLTTTLPFLQIVTIISLRFIHMRYEAFTKSVKFPQGAFVKGKSLRSLIILSLIIHTVFISRAEIDLLQLLDMQKSSHYNVSATEDDRGCPAYQIGQYATLFLSTAAAFGPL